MRALVVARVVVDGALRLQLAAPSRLPRAGVEVVVESTFLHCAANGYRSLCTPDRPATVAPALAVLHRSVEWASTSDEGALTLAFDDGSGLTVWPNSDFEAWQVVGPGSALVVCMPGGGRPAEWSDVVAS
jgi:Family of unknown function (DUF6188)